MNSKPYNRKRGFFPSILLEKTLLDSSLIIQSNKILYNIKVVRCGDYIQTYKTEKKYMKSNNSCCPITQLIEKHVYSEDKPSSIPSYKEIRLDNAMRSKISIQRLIKTNEKEFLTFITLTFKENITSIIKANKLFGIWRTRIKEIFPNFKYVCVPEYQKRGAVHYHLITNIPLKGSIITLQKGKCNQYDVPYWNGGFTSVYVIDCTSKVSSYMSKYMTKDISNKLFGRRRYFYSQNLKVPKVEFLNTDDIKSLEYINKILENKNICYANIYLNKYTNEKIEFMEYKLFI